MIDNVLVTLKAGNGGNGCVSYHTNRRISKGGPDGGDGGNGGDIIFKGCKQLRTLEYYQYSPNIKAEPGINGSSQSMNGRNGEDKICTVPLGTQIWNEDESEVLADITDDEQIFIAVKGGIGGFGNEHFKNASNQTPDYAENGTQGEECKLTLKLKLIADVGIIGLPNAGKSSFLRSISNSKTKVADYPFTTLRPELGTITYQGKQIVFADIPGLIEDAHQGRGLGHYFLSHVERCSILLHLIDITNEDILSAYKIIRHELEMYASELKDKPEIIVLTKKDMLTESECNTISSGLHKLTGKQIYIISNFANTLSDPLFKQINSSL